MKKLRTMLLFHVFTKMREGKNNEVSNIDVDTMF